MGMVAGSTTCGGLAPACVSVLLPILPPAPCRDPPHLLRRDTSPVSESLLPDPAIRSRSLSLSAPPTAVVPLIVGEGWPADDPSVGESGLPTPTSSRIRELTSKLSFKLASVARA